ncbi:MAG TPA: DUF190 domain-containing protein [Vicinamibacterales bacterium]|jgi:hypothetical protein|nr:DUF190 domain-containing protein [Vicinamibacterales bacterium]
MVEPVKVLLLFVNEADVWKDVPLYYAIVQRLRHLEIAGATVLTGTLSFGHHRRLHHKGLLGISDDRAITILAVDNEAKLRAAIPDVREMMTEGLTLLLDAELVLDLPQSV